MDYKALFKKYWFVCLIGVVLVVFIGIYAVDAYNNRELTVDSKQIDGQYAVYSVDDEYVFADDFYDSIYEQNGISVVYRKYENAILEKAYETTDDMKDIASNAAYYYYMQYGADGLASLVQAYGYTNGVDDAEDFYINLQKERLLLSSQYLEENEETETPRMVYQILVSVADVETATDEEGNETYILNPTEEEQAKLDTVLAALEDGQDFLEVQEVYNEDGSNDAYFVDASNTSSFVESFLTPALALEDGETSEVVESQYGYHIIKSYGADVDLMLNNENFLNLLYNDAALVARAYSQKGEELGFSIVNEELNNYINTLLESEDAQ